MVPKVPPLPYRKVDRLLRQHGFEPVRQSGSHVTYADRGGRSTVVPRHGGDVSPRLLRKILKDAGIDPEEVRR